MTTPEKFDSVTRWCCMSDPSLMQTFKLVMIDEVHMLNDEDRGHVLEAVVSRLKTAGQSCDENCSKILGEGCLKQDS